MNPVLLSLKEKLLEAAFNQSLNAIVITDADFENNGPHIVLCNEAFIRMTGYEQHELIGKNPRMLQGPRTDRSVINELRRCLKTGEFFLGRVVNYRKDGVPYLVEWNISALYGDDGKICNYVSVQSDLTVQTKAERERDILSKALYETQDSVMVTDGAGLIWFVNKGFEKLTGYTSEEVLNRPPFFWVSGANTPFPSHGVTYPDSQTDAEASQKYDVVRKRDGSLAHLMNDIFVLEFEDTVSTYRVCISVDVSAQFQLTETLERLAHTDQLTGLLNRHAGVMNINQVKDQAAVSGNPFSLIICDIDHFKRINDQFGHLAGDQVLKQVASLLQASVRGADYCVRWGGEEFLVVLPSCLIGVAGKLADRFREKVKQLEDDVVGQVTISLGVAQWNKSESVDDLIMRADQALYKAKHAGRNRAFLA